MIIPLLLDQSLGQIIEGLALLLSVGFNGLGIHLTKEFYRREEDLLEANKRQAQYAEELEFRIDTLKKDVTTRDSMIADLVMNQKPVPWNKGKKGYKLPRRKTGELPGQTYVLSDNPIITKWKENADGTLTEVISPKWEPVAAPKSGLYQEVFGG